MSDFWPFSSSSPPPPRSHPQVPVYHLVPQTQVSLPYHLPEPQVTSLNPPEPQTKATSLDLVLKNQVTSPVLPEPQVTSPSFLLKSQETFAHLLPQTRVNSPHLIPESPVISSPLVPKNQETYMHLVPESQETSSNHSRPKVTSPPFVPKSQETFTHHVPKTQLTSPNLPYPQATTPHCFVQSQRTPPFFVARSQEAFAHFLPQTQENSSHLIPESQVTPPHHPNPQVTSPPFEPMSQETFAHLEPQPQVTSPNLPYPQAATPHRFAQTPVTSPPFVAESPVTSPYFVAKNQVTSHHLVPQTQVTSPHLLPQTQVATSNCFDLAQTSTPYLPYSTSPHLHQPHVTSSHLAPESQVTSPHFVPQITFPNFPDHHITSPHIFYLPQHHLANINLDLENPDWTRSEPPSELLRSYSHTTAHLDLQNQFSTGVTHHRDELEDTPKLPYNTHLARDVYGQADAPGPAQDTWRPALSPLGSLTGGVPQGRWSSVEFSSSSAEDFSSTQFYHDDSSPQPFCSPTTPGPSPHYPQTPTISSPQTQPSKDRLDFHTQTSRPLSRDKTLSCCLQDFDMYLMTSDPGRRHQTTRHLLQSQSGLVQDQTGLLHTVGNFVSCFSPQRADQDVSGSAQRPDLLTGLNQREERGGRGDDTQKMKLLQPENCTEDLLSRLPDSRLLCTVCQRDFRSLPALNGHMRSHSRSRSAAWLNKGNDSSPPVQPCVSMVTPISVPVQSRGGSRACRGGQRRCSRRSPITGGAVSLYRSLLRQEEEEAADGEAGDGAVAGGDGAHYKPPPMLCPLRPGPGLYCSLATRRQQRVQTVQLHNTRDGPGDLVAMETDSPPPGTLINKPRINEGRGFQADIPSLRDRKHAHADSHNALLLWMPWDELERPVIQQRVEALLSMARSSVVPGGGASAESALHVLSECRGDFLLTVEKLLSTPETADRHTSQRHPGGSWSAAERKLMLKSLQLHHKDFNKIHKDVQTRSVSECVEFYYLWKKKLSL